MTERRVLVGTVDGLFALGDGSPDQTLRGHRITGLVDVAGGDHGGRRMALVDGGWLWAGGEAWEPVLSLERWGATCLASVDGALLAGTPGAHLLRVDEGGGAAAVVESFDRAEGRDSWYTPWGGPPDTRSIAGAAGAAIYVNVHVGGILRSLDGGSTWQPTIDIHADVHQVVAVSRERVVAAAAVGLAVSDDGGTNWRVETDGLHATYLRAVALAGDYLFVSASDGPGGGRSGVYRYPYGAAPRSPSETPGAGRFERCVDGLPEWFSGNVDTGCLQADGDTVALGSPDGSLFVSDDVGRSWTTLATGLPRITCVAVAVADGRTGSPKV